MPERRNLTRIGYHTQIEIFSGNEKIAEAETENLSIKGVLVKAKELKKDDPCRVVINLSGGPEAIKLDIEGKVVRLSEDGEAVILFKEMELETFEHLQNIIVSNDGDPDKIHKELLDHIKAKHE